MRASVVSRKELANLVPDADVRRGARTRRLAYRRLIDFEHATDALPTLDRLDVRERRRLAALRRDEPREIPMQHVADQRALPLPLTPVTQTSRASGKAASSPCRLLRVTPLSSSRPGGPRRPRAAAAADGGGGEASTRPVDRALGREQVRERAVHDRLRRRCARAGPQVDDVLGAPNRLLVVLDDDDRVALRAASAAMRVEQTALSRACRPIVGSSRM